MRRRQRLVHLPESVANDASERAHELGMTLENYLRRCVYLERKTLGNPWVMKTFTQMTNGEVYEIDMV